jgi:hypothetical protein
MPKYLYCITKENGMSTYPIMGLEEASVHTIPHEGLSCVVSDTGPEKKELTREAVLAHERVLEAVMQSETIVPIAFGHVVPKEEDIKTKMIELHKEKIEELLTFLSGKIELSLKALWRDIAPIFADIAETNKEIRALKAKKRLARADQIRAGEIAAYALGKKREETESDIISHFQNITLDHKKTKIFGDQMVTNLAFLIRAHDLSAFDKKVNEYSDKKGGPNLMLKYTGPVPPYNFVDVRFTM